VIEPLVRFEPGAADHDYELYDQAVDLLAGCKLALDPEQLIVLRALLARRGDGKWSYLQVGLTEPRQNGKGELLEARELVGVALVETDRLLIHSAHEYATALEAFYRMQARCEEGGIAIKRVRQAHGEQGIDFANGTRLRYRTRTRGGGRGFSCDQLSLDEDMVIPEFVVSALLPTLSARPNAQVVYSGSAVDQLTHEHGLVKARIREAGIAGKDHALAYFEWSLPYDSPEEVPVDVLEDAEAWRSVNPAMAYGRISEEFIRSVELPTLGPRGFAVERLGVGDWPATDLESGAMIHLDDWLRLEDRDSELFDPVCLAFDVSPDRNGAIAAAGRNAEGHFHVEITDSRQGTNWIAARLVGLARQHGPLVIVCDERGPGASLIHEVSEALLDVGYELELASGAQNAQACGLIVDAVRDQTLRHRGDDRITNAIRGAGTRPLGDAWSWARRHSSANISPLFAITLALWAASGAPDLSKELAIY